MIQALNIGREGESAAQSAHYSREPGRGGTGIDEGFLLPYEGDLIIYEGLSAMAQKGFELSLKTAEKFVIRLKLRWAQKKKAAAAADAASAGQEAQSGANQEIEDLKKQLRGMDSAGSSGGGAPPEGMTENIMDRMDYYKNKILAEGMVQEFFKLFNKGKTTEEVLQHYARQGVQIPEQYLSKVNKYFESFKKLTLDLKFANQEANDFKKITDTLNTEQEEEKKLSSQIYKK